MDLGEILSQRRRTIGMSVDELVKEAGIPKGTVNKVLTGVTKDPQLGTVKALAYAVGLSLEDLDDNVSRETINHSEETLLRTYRTLDKHGKHVVDLVLEAEHARCTELKSEKPLE